MTDKIGEFTRSYWPVIAGLVAVAVAWGVSTAQIAGVARSNEIVLSKLDRQSDALTDIKADVAGIRATNASAAAVVADLQARVRAVEARR